MFVDLVTKILSGSAGKLVEQVGGIIDSVHTSDEERAKLKLKLQEIINAHEAAQLSVAVTELQAKERVLVAELQQSSTFTKMARPSIVYAGLALFLYNCAVIPTVQMLTDRAIEPFVIPSELTLAWAGIRSTYAIGRTVEKRSKPTKDESLAELLKK